MAFLPGQGIPYGQDTYRIPIGGLSPIPGYQTTPGTTGLPGGPGGIPYGNDARVFPVGGPSPLPGYQTTSGSPSGPGGFQLPQPPTLPPFGAGIPPMQFNPGMYSFGLLNNALQFPGGFGGQGFNFPSGNPIPPPNLPSILGQINSNLNNNLGRNVGGNTSVLPIGSSLLQPNFAQGMTPGRGGMPTGPGLHGESKRDYIQQILANPPSYMSPESVALLKYQLATQNANQGWFQPSGMQIGGMDLFDPNRGPTQYGSLPHGITAPNIGQVASTFGGWPSRYMPFGASAGMGSQVTPASERDFMVKNQIWDKILKDITGYTSQQGVGLAFAPSDVRNNVWNSYQQAMNQAGLGSMLGNKTPDWLAGWTPGK